MTAAIPTKTNTADADEILTRLLKEMPEPWMEYHRTAITAFKDGDYGKVRALAASNLDDPYCKALGYMCSIPKMPPTLAVLLAEAARAIAECQRESAVNRLNLINAELLGV